MDEDGYREFIAKRRKIVEAMDKTDGHKQIDLGLDMALVTVLMAIRTGVCTNDFDAVGDAVVMLEQVRASYGKTGYPGD